MPNATTKNTKTYYRSLEEHAESEAFRQRCEHEFPAPLPVEGEGVALSRRDFLKAFGFSTAAVAAASCSPMPVEKAIPYLVPSEQVLPGKATWYSSTCSACPAQCGVMVKTREGRPIKLEGNPGSPLNRGGLCAVGQASVLDLYDSGRLHGPLIDNKPATWGEVDTHVRRALADAKRIRLLTQTITSPTFQDLLRRFQAKYPQCTRVTYDAVSVSGLLNAHESAFGKRDLPHLHFDRADLVVSFGADFLGSWLSPVEFARQFRERRQAGPNMARHIQFESRLSLTGANADERFLMKPTEELAVAMALWRAVTGKAVSQPALSESLQPAIARVSAELKTKRGRSLVLSASNDENVQLAVLAINEALGNYGQTLDLQYPSYQKQGVDAALPRLLQEMESGSVDLLIVYGCNPVYDLSKGRRFEEALKNVKVVISLANRLDETAAVAQIVAPDHHFLESWSDHEPRKGLFHFTQPVISPVYSTRHAGESLLAWMGLGGTFEGAMKGYWARQVNHFSRFWPQALRNGFYQASKEKKTLPLRMSAKVEPLLTKIQIPASSDEYVVEVFESVLLRDGRHANNPWLQETPDPITKVTWGNVAQIAVVEGKRLGLSQGDVVRLSAGEVSMEIPVILQPGQMEGTIAIAGGYGRNRAGKVGDGVGQNAFTLVEVDGVRLFHMAGVRLEKTLRHEPLALTQIHYALENRPLVKEMTLAELRAGGEADHQHYTMLWEEHEPGKHAWGLAIDLSACNGCSACLVSCQAENNVPVVGKEEVRRQREMHWIRIDRYYEGDLANPDVVFEPMLCQHCGNAPCESVCPVLATVHSSEGLNQQVYNRCVGTRYCANNCPYKVRRFNWFDYADNKRFDFHLNDELGKLVLNPDVTVRSRGVMEKCSLCVQRIQEEKMKARRAGKPLGDIQTACQQSCPTQAIVFGDRHDPESVLTKIVQKNPRAFHVLGELNVRPAVTYLAKVRNRTDA